MKFDSTIPVQYVTKGKGKKKKKIPYLASTGCTGGQWKFKYIADYTTTYDSTIESTQTVETTQKCTQVDALRSIAVITGRAFGPAPYRSGAMSAGAPTADPARS